MYVRNVLESATLQGHVTEYICDNQNACYVRQFDKKMTILAAVIYTS